MAAAGGYASLVPHMRPGAPRWRVEWMGDSPPSLRMYLGGGLRVFMALKVLLCIGNDASPQNRSVLRAMHNPTAPKVISACSGGYCLSIQRAGVEQKVLCGALGGHFRQRRLWLAMVVMVDVGRWRHTWHRPTVGIVKIFYRSIFFYSYVVPIHSWHLTRQLNKEELDLHTLAFRCFLCLVFYTMSMVIHPNIITQLYLHSVWGQINTMKTVCALLAKVHIAH
jgi:hypothetical protein